MRPLALLFPLLLLSVSFPAGHAEDGGVVVVDRDVEIGPGVPDEIVFAPPRLEQVDVPFTLGTPVARVVGTLSWPDDGGVTDIDFELVSPSGATTGAQGQSAANPERAELGAGPAGEWRARIYPFTSVSTTARLTIVAYPAGAEPLVALLDGDDGVGALDVADHYAITRGGTPPYAYAWDTDGDGVYVPGLQTHSTTFAPGAHEVRVRVTDALGQVAVSSRAIVAFAKERDLQSVCGGDAFAAYWAMEYNQTHDTCWVHDGHHTYYYGESTYALHAVLGFAFAVEEQFSPGVESDLFVETSLDGLAWTVVGRGAYAMLPPADDPLAVPTRQQVQFDIVGSGQKFRYLRVHMPPSALQGLSGYLDHTDLHVVADEAEASRGRPVSSSSADEAEASRGRPVSSSSADEADPVDAPELAPSTRALRCEDAIMERFFETHPCTYGGVDRWDSASFYHTYVVGDGAVLDRVQGSFTLAPFRLDDFFIGEERPEGTAAYVITSDDGRTWTHEATIPALYGVPTAFDVALDGRAARFVRLFPQYHAAFDDTADEPSLHHPRAFFLTSEVVVEGLLPA